jgi:hypothetical protein
MLSVRHDPDSSAAFHEGSVRGRGNVSFLPQFLQQIFFDNTGLAQHFRVLIHSINSSS